MDFSMNKPVNAQQASARAKEIVDFMKNKAETLKEQDQTAVDQDPREEWVKTESNENGIDSNATLKYSRKDPGVFNFKNQEISSGEKYALDSMEMQMDTTKADKVYTIVHTTVELGDNNIKNGDAVGEQVVQKKDGTAVYHYKKGSMMDTPPDLADYNINL